MGNVGWDENTVNPVRNNSKLYVFLVVIIALGAVLVLAVSIPELSKEPTVTTSPVESPYTSEPHDKLSAETIARQGFLAVSSMDRKGGHDETEKEFFDPEPDEKTKEKIRNLIKRIDVGYYSLAGIKKHSTPKERLVSIGAPAVLPLIKALRSQRSQVRYYVIETLAEIGDKRAIDPLIQILNGDDMKDASQALYALGKIGSNRVISAISNRLSTFQDPWMRVKAASVLGKIGHIDVIVPLLDSLREDKNDDVRQSVIRALGDIGHSSTVMPLLDVLVDLEENWEVRSCAASSLGQIGDERAVQSLIRELMNYKESGIADPCSWALGRIGKASLNPLLIALMSKDSTIKYYSVRSLGMIGHKDAVVPLIGALRDESKTVRGATALALGNIGDERSVEPLKSCFTENMNEKYTDDVFLKINFASALVRISGDREAFNYLLGCLEDKRWNRIVRRKTRRELRQITHNKANFQWNLEEWNHWYETEWKPNHGEGK